MSTDKCYVSFNTNRPTSLYKRILMQGFLSKYYNYGADVFDAHINEWNEKFDKDFPDADTKPGGEQEDLYFHYIAQLANDAWLTNAPRDDEKKYNCALYTCPEIADSVGVKYLGEDLYGYFTIHPVD